MKVSDLRKALEGVSDDAEVLISSWDAFPFGAVWAGFCPPKIFERHETDKQSFILSTLHPDDIST